MKKIIGASLLFLGSLFGYDADDAAKDLACKTITADAYYAKYTTIGSDNWWTYIANDGSLVISHKQGTTVKDMGKTFFVITDEFIGKPTFKYENGKVKISMPSMKTSFSFGGDKLSNNSITADAYYAKFTKVDGNNWWTYVANDGSLIIAHQQGTTVKDMGKTFFVITDEFNGKPTFKYENGKLEIKFPPLKGQDSCANTTDNNTSIQTPPAPTTDADLDDNDVPPSPPSTN
jgi:hypothetical protein